ncbi:MAG: DUF721 domain-containing protein [Acidimicrobiales bacterium]|nr:DUF721 domain-containing protein [Actinomycetota bacterium]MDA8182944.1 DUF721 domain-containing protein [Actinomycetota bacterium]
MTGRARRYSSGPVKIGESLSALYEAIGGGGGSWVPAVAAGWEETVGRGMAAHVRLLRVEGSTLVVAVDHPAWATQVRHMEKDILDRVRARAQAETGGNVAGLPSAISVRVRR